MHLEELERYANDYASMLNPSSQAGDWARGRALGLIEKVTPIIDKMRRANDNAPKTGSDDVLEQSSERERFLAKADQRLKFAKNLLENTKSNIVNDAKLGMTREERRRKAGEEDNQRFIDSELSFQERIDQENEEKLQVLDNVVMRWKQGGVGVGHALMDDKEQLDDMNDAMDDVQTNINNMIKRMVDFLDNKNGCLWIGCIILTTILVAMIIYAWCLPSK